jgi:hypothetical protein
MAAHKNQFEDLPDEHIRHLVRSLESLHEGELGVAMLVACGNRAIGPLRELLLYGKPSSIAEPRQRAVRALADLGAQDVLLEYLRAPKHIGDPAIRLGEEAVENTAARALARWPTEDVFVELLYLAARRPLTGVLETLAAFRRPETIPHFVSALGDDLAHRTAEDALRALGEEAWPALIDAVRTPDPSRPLETPTSRLRRTRAVRLLAEAGLRPEHWPALEALLHEPDHQLAAAVCRIALQIAPERVHARAVQRLFEALDFADWFAKAEIEDTLFEQFTTLKDAIREEIQRRKRLPQAHRDPALPVLLAVERRAADEHMRRCLLK